MIIICVLFVKTNELKTLLRQAQSRSSLSTIRSLVHGTCRERSSSRHIGLNVSNVLLSMKRNRGSILLTLRDPKTGFPIWEGDHHLSEHFRHLSDRHRRSAGRVEGSVFGADLFYIFKGLCFLKKLFSEGEILSTENVNE